MNTILVRYNFFLPKNNEDRVKRNGVLRMILVHIYIFKKVNFSETTTTTAVVTLTATEDTSVTEGTTIEDHLETNSGLTATVPEDTTG